MSGHPLWPDDIEKDLATILKSVKDEKIPAQIKNTLEKLEMLIADAKEELAAIKKTRERIFGADNSG